MHQNAQVFGALAEGPQVTDVLHEATQHQGKVATSSLAMLSSTCHAGYPHDSSAVKQLPI